MLASRLPDLTVRGVAAGLYAVIELPPELDEAAVLRAARARGIALEGRGVTQPGLVLGYADIDAAAIKPAVTELAASIHDARKQANLPQRPAGRGVGGGAQVTQQTGSAAVRAATPAGTSS
jgi:hypothetical protein